MIRKRYICFRMLSARAWVPVFTANGVVSDRIAAAIRAVGCAAFLAVQFGAIGQAWAALPTGSGSFIWDDNTGASDPDKPLRVYYYRPSTVTAETPVWIILHGTDRNANDYRNYFVNAAASQKALVLAPQFDDDDWPGSRSYNLGNISISESNLTPRDRSKWSFSKIEPLFDYVTNTLEPSIAVDQYSLFGHSAGAQFVHRFLMWEPDARVNMAIAANAGWYTMAQYGSDLYSYNWPYSLNVAPDYDTLEPGVQGFPSEHLDSALSNRLIVLLGDQDVQQDGDLRTSPEANAQGANRLERGQFFFAEAEKQALSRDLNFGWDMQIVPGVAHSGSQMAVRAAQLFRFADVLPGDYNANGTIDATDYSVWRQSYGTEVVRGTGADGNGDGVVDAADYTIWRNNMGVFGAGGVALTHVDAVRLVPEPHALVIAALFLAFTRPRSSTQRRMV